jgi:hypothetical protein
VCVHKRLFFLWLRRSPLRDARHLMEREAAERVQNRSE